MNEAQVIEVIRQWWLDQYEAVSSVVWDDDEDPEPVGQPWLRVSIRSAGTERRGVGRSKEEHRGTVMVQMFSPRTDGPGQLERDSSDVAQIWRDFRHERIRMDAPSVVSLAAEGAFNRRLVTLGWRADMRF